MREDPKILPALGGCYLLGARSFDWSAGTLLTLVVRKTVPRNWNSLNKEDRAVGSARPENHPDLCCGMRLSFSSNGGKCQIKGHPFPVACGAGVCTTTDHSIERLDQAANQHFTVIICTFAHSDLNEVLFHVHIKTESPCLSELRDVLEFVPSQEHGLFANIERASVHHMSSSGSRSSEPPASGNSSVPSSGKRNSRSLLCSGSSGRQRFG